VVTNTASYVTTLAAAFVMYPVMIQKLGPARYGLWMLISELTGYYSYVGLGIRAGVVYYAALFLAQSDRRQLNETLSTSVWSLSIVGTILALSGFALASLFPSMFGSAGLDPRETWESIVIMAFAVGISLPQEAMNSTLTAAKRLDVVNGFEMVTRIVTSAAMLISVLQGGGLASFSLIQLFGRLIATPCTCVAMYRIIPDLSLSLEHWRVESLKRLSRFGFPSVLIGAGWLVSSRTDLVVIAATLGVPMTAYYAIPRSLMEYADAGIRAIAWSFSSHLTHLHALEKQQETMRLYLRGARILSVTVFLLTAYIAAFGTSFLAIWQGSTFVIGPWRNRASVVLLILIAAFLPRLIHNMATQLFYATNRLRFLMWISLLEGAVKIGLSLILVKSWGLAGVAISNLIPMLLFEGVAIPFYLLKTYPADAAAYFRDVLTRPLLAGIVAYLVSSALVAWAPPGDWLHFLMLASISAAVGIAIAFGLTGVGEILLVKRGEAFT
jgi:O-antigen/teichoic acid export membrane protein